MPKKSASAVLDRQRIDKWLWHARVVRTRTAAAELADRGRVRVNAIRIRAASHAVRTGDVVTVALDHVRILKVLSFSERRGSAGAARSLYEDLSPAPPAAGDPHAPAIREDRSGWPTGRDRRAIIRLKRPDNG